MNRLAVIMSLALLHGASVRAQATSHLHEHDSDAATRAEIERARDAVWRAWFAADSAALERLIPGALAAGSPSEWRDRASSFADAREFVASGRRLVELRFDSTTITRYGDVALVHARYAFVVKDSSGQQTSRHGIANEIFIRKNDHWVNPLWYLE
jgi:hypothetical protein